jgi:serine/threonine protein kinase
MSLLEKLCVIKPSYRYRLEQALSHPFITRNLEDKVPRTALEENIHMFECDSKLRKVVNLLHFVSIVRQRPIILK